jgi:hypothetical protein
MSYTSDGEWRAFVHLAYLDEAGTSGHSSCVMYGALIVPTGNFGYLEGLHNTAIQQILGLDEIEEKFEEFHASALYNGDVPFDGIPPDKRFQAIKVLLTAVKVENLPYVYAAIDRKAFQSSPAKSAEIIDFAFHVCLLGGWHTRSAKCSWVAHPCGFRKGGAVFSQAGRL